MNKTLVVVKPDGVERNLVGEVIRRFEEGGLKVLALKMLQVDEELVSKHYLEDPDYMKSIGEKAASSGEQVDDPIEYGRGIVRGLKTYLTSGPVVAMVLEGENAVLEVRRITGATNPPNAEKGTVRGDLGQDSFAIANQENRPVRNLVHASGNDEEAQKEIELWFPELN
jgi:nucleoside-diphosphate kinase